MVEREGRGQAGRGGGGGEEAAAEGGGDEGAAHLVLPAPPVVLPPLPRAGRSFHSREGIEEGGGE